MLAPADTATASRTSHFGAVATVSLEPTGASLPSATPIPSTGPAAVSTRAPTREQGLDSRSLGADSALGAPPVAEVGADRHELPDTTHVWQKWNNCGPSAILMAASAFGLYLDQMEVAAALKPDREDTNVTPDELAAFAKARGLLAVVRYGGDRVVAGKLLRSGVPVVAEQWIDVEGRGEMGHYRTVTGFDDPAAEFVVQDSYYGPRRRYSYDDFEAMWRPFLGAYVVVYLPGQQALVESALGADIDDAAMWRRVLTTSEGWVARQPSEAWAWFAFGEALSHNARHEEAVVAFQRAISIGLPTRAFWYQFGYYRSLSALERYEDLVAHAEATIATMSGENLEESHYWRGVGLRGLEREAEAQASFTRALEFNPLFRPAAEALRGS